jgi:hypothetical protein
VSAAADSTLCPSARCRPGALLLGVVLPSGRVGFAPNEIVVDEGFDRVARAGRAPEQRFRFAQPCAKRGCQNWGGSRCGVADALVSHAQTLPVSVASEGLPDCPIRSSCRWFQQAQGRACAVCQFVVTDGSGDRDATLADAVDRVIPGGTNVLALPILM